MSTNSTTNSGAIFNVPEATGLDRVGLETTAADAQINAPTSSIARKIEENAEHVQDVAHDAANVAKSKGQSLTGTTPTEQFQQQAKQTTNAAVAEGQHDVEAAKVAGTGYINQVKNVASSAISTAQSYLPASVGGGSHESTASKAHDTTQPGIVSSLQSSAAAALDTTKEYLASAQEAVQPHVEHAKGVAQGYLGTAGTQGAQTNNAQTTPASSTGIPATSAPLESGPHTIDTPYPTTTTTTGTNVGANAA